MPHLLHSRNPCTTSLPADCAHQAVLLAGRVRHEGLLRTTLHGMSHLLQLPSAHPAPAAYHQLKALLRPYALQALPYGWPCDMDEYSLIYLIPQVVLERDAHLAQLPRLQEQHSLTSSDLSCIAQAQAKLASFNFLLRLFEALGAVTPALNRAQLSWLQGLISRRDLPLDGRRLIRAACCYCQEAGNPRYDYACPEHCLSPVPAAQAAELLECLAQLAARSSAPCAFDPAYPGYAALSRRYHELCPGTAWACLHNAAAAPHAGSGTAVTAFFGSARIRDIPAVCRRLMAWHRQHQQSPALAAAGDRLSYTLRRYYPGRRLLLEQALNRCAAQHHDLLLPLPGALRLRGSPAGSSAAWSSSDLLTCISYPFISYEDHADRPAQALLEKLRDHLRPGSGPELSILMLMVVLPALDESAWRCAACMFGRYRAGSSPQLLQAMAWHQFFYALGPGRRVQLSAPLRTCILHSPPLKYALFARMIHAGRSLKHIHASQTFILYSCLYEIFDLARCTALRCTPEDFVRGTLRPLQHFCRELSDYARRRHKTLFCITPQQRSCRYRFPRPLLNELFESHALLKLFTDLLAAELQTLEYVHLDYELLEEYLGSRGWHLPQHRRADWLSACRLPAPQAPPPPAAGAHAGRSEGQRTCGHAAPAGTSPRTQAEDGRAGPERRPARSQTASRTRAAPP